MEDGKRRRGRKAPGALEMVNILLKVGVKDRVFLPSPLLAILMMETSYGYLVWPDTRSSRKGRQGMVEGERERARNVTEISCGYRRAKASFA